MADASYSTQVWEAVTKPDAWDAGGAIFTTAEEAFTQFGELLGKLRNGSLALADAQRLDKVVRYIANGASNAAARVAAINVPVMTAEDQKIKAFFARLAQQGQTLVQDTGLMLDEVAAGTASAAQRLTANATSLLKLGGTVLAVLQVAMAFNYDGEEEAAKKAAGALGGIAGTIAGASLGAGLGSLVASAASAVGIAVSSTLAAAVGAVVGAAGVGYVAGKSLEEAYAPYIRPYLTDLFEEGGAAWTRAETFYRDSLARLGKFDGTWLESLDASAEQKAALTTLIAGVSNLPVSMQMNADVKRLLEAPFDTNTLVSRDVLIRTVMLIAKELHTYTSERVTVDSSVVTLNMPPYVSGAMLALRELVQKQLSPADQAGLAITGPSRVIVALASGTLSGTANSDLLLGSAQADTLLGEAGNDELVAGGGADDLKGGTGTDVLFGQDGNDVLDGGTGADYLYGGAGTDRYVFTDAFGGDWVVDSDGQGTIEVDGLVLTGAHRKAAEGYYVDDATGWSYTVAEGDLILRKGGSPHSIRVRNWQPGQLGITLDDSAAPTPPTSVVEGDYAKKKNVAGDLYLTTQDGDYISDGPELGAQDVLLGFDVDEEIRGYDGNDAIQGYGGEDLIDGGKGDDLLLGGGGADTLNGGEGNDVIYGSAQGSIWRPEEVDFTPPAVPEGTVEVSRGFSWVTYRSNVPRGMYVGTVYAAGAGLSPAVLGPDGYYYVESTGNVIDAGLGNDFVAAGTADDVVHAGDGDDDVMGLGGADALYGDDGADLMWGDGLSDTNALNYTPNERHGDDVMVGGAGNDTLNGQGGADELYGGDDDDVLWGDAIATAVPAEIQGNDYLDGGNGLDFLAGSGRDDVLFGGAGNDTLRGDDNQDTVAGHCMAATTSTGKRATTSCWATGQTTNSTAALATTASGANRAPMHPRRRDTWTGPTTATTTSTEKKATTICRAKAAPTRCSAGWATTTWRVTASRVFWPAPSTVLTTSTARTATTRWMATAATTPSLAALMLTG